MIIMNDYKNFFLKKVIINIKYKKNYIYIRLKLISI